LDISGRLFPVWTPALAGLNSGFSRTFLTANGQIFRGRGGINTPSFFRKELLIPSSRTPLLEPQNSQDLTLNPPKLLIFGESKEKALIYILIEAIYFPLSFA
jgi:hypothetical protein